MKRNYKSINEEVNRIKMLFGESRLYGNMVTESYTLDDIENKKKELLKTLTSWEGFNNVRTGMYKEKIKAEIGEEIKTSRVLINGISRANSCTKETVAMINKKIVELKERKKEFQIGALLRTSKPDKEYYESVEKILGEMKTICSDMTPDTPAPTTPDTPAPTTPGCVGDCENGEGTKTYDSGAVYIGGFKNGKKSGQGTYKYASGSVYVGEYKDGKKNGQGKFTKSDGSVYEGEFKDNKFVGGVSDEVAVSTTVEVFKDKGGKYHYAKLPDGKYWYSTDGTNWKQQTTQKGMDAIETRINSSKVDSLGKVKASTIDSSYTEPEGGAGGEDGALDSNNNAGGGDGSTNVEPGTETEGGDESDTMWETSYDEILNVSNEEGDDILFYDIWYKHPSDETNIQKEEDIVDWSIQWEPVGGTRILFDKLSRMFSERDQKTPSKKMKIKNDDGVLMDNDGNMFYIPLESDSGVDAITTVKDKRDNDKDDKGEMRRKFAGPGGCRERMGEYGKLAEEGIKMKDAFGDKVDEARGYIEWCLGNYHSKLEKIGLFKKGKAVYIMKSQWGIEYEKADGGVIGQKYDIIVNGRSRGKIKKVGENEYRIRSKPKEKIFGRNKQLKNGYQEAIYKAISLPKDEALTVVRTMQDGPIQLGKLLSRVV